MHPWRSCVLSLVAGSVALALLSSAARADVAPPDQCTGQAGQACSNAGPSYDQAGVCVSTTCSHATPDGSTQQPCVLCEIADGGAGSGDGGSSSGSSSKSSCATSPATRDGATGLAMLALGVGALAWTRRRRP